MIPTYGQASVLHEAISSALAQDYQSLEVIVADDSSPDETPEVVSAYASDPRLRYHRNTENLGRVANYRHTLYELARGKYVLNLDGDDWLVDPTYVRRAVDILEAEPETVLVFAHTWHYREEDGTRFRLSGQNVDLGETNSGTEIFLRYPTREVWIPHLTCVYRREDATRIGFYQHDTIGSDTESILRLILGRDVAFVDDVVAAWRVHGESASATLDVNEAVSNLIGADAPFAAAVSLGVADRPTLLRWRSSMRQRICLDFLRRAAKHRDYAAMARFMFKVYGRSPRAAVGAAVAALAYAFKLRSQRRFLPTVSGLREDVAG